MEELKCSLLGLDSAALSVHWLSASWQRRRNEKKDRRRLQKQQTRLPLVDEESSQTTGEARGVAAPSSSTAHKARQLLSCTPESGRTPLAIWPSSSSNSSCSDSSTTSSTSFHITEDWCFSSLGSLYSSSSSRSRSSARASSSTSCSTSSSHSESSLVSPGTPASAPPLSSTLRGSPSGVPPPPRSSGGLRSRAISSTGVLLHGAHCPPGRGAEGTLLGTSAPAISPIAGCHGTRSRVLEASHSDSVHSPDRNEETTRMMCSSSHHLGPNHSKHSISTKQQEALVPSDSHRPHRRCHRRKGRKAKSSSDAFQLLNPVYRSLLHPTEVQLLHQLLPLGLCYRFLSSTAEDVAIGKCEGLYMAAVGAALRKILSQYTSDVRQLQSPSTALQLVYRYRLTFQLLTGMVRLLQHLQRHQGELVHQHCPTTHAPTSDAAKSSDHPPHPRPSLRLFLDRLHCFLTHQEVPDPFRAAVGESVWLSLLYGIAHFVAHGVVLRGHRNEFFVVVQPAANPNGSTGTAAPPSVPSSSPHDLTSLALHVDRLPVGITPETGMQILRAGKERRLLLTETQWNATTRGSTSGRTLVKSASRFAHWRNPSPLTDVPLSAGMRARPWDGGRGVPSNATAAPGGRKRGLDGSGASCPAPPVVLLQNNYLEQLALGAQDDAALSVFGSLFTRTLCEGGRLAVEELAARVHTAKALWTTALWEQLSPDERTLSQSPSNQRTSGPGPFSSLRDRIAQLQDLYLLRRGDVWNTFVEKMLPELFEGTTTSTGSAPAATSTALEEEEQDEARVDPPRHPAYSSIGGLEKHYFPHNTRDGSATALHRSASPRDDEEQPQQQRRAVAPSSPATSVVTPRLRRVAAEAFRFAMHVSDYYASPPTVVPPRPHCRASCFGVGKPCSAAPPPGVGAEPHANEEVVELSSAEGSRGKGMHSHASVSSVISAPGAAAFEEAKHSHAQNEEEEPDVFVEEVVEGSVPPVLAPTSKPEQQSSSTASVKTLPSRPLLPRVGRSGVSSSGLPPPTTAPSRNGPSEEQPPQVENLDNGEEWLYEDLFELQMHEPRAEVSWKPLSSAPTAMATSSVEYGAQLVLQRMAALELHYTPQNARFHPVAGGGGRRGGHSLHSAPTGATAGEGVSPLRGGGLPLIINPPAFAYYQHLFRFLLRLHVSLLAVQQLRPMFAEAIIPNRRPSTALRRALRLFQLIHYFLHTLQQYLQVDVLYVACYAMWQQMTPEKGCTGLERAQRLHHHALWRMVEGSFLSDLDAVQHPAPNDAGLGRCITTSPLREACDALCLCACSFVILCQRYRVSSWAVEPPHSVAGLFPAPGDETPEEKQQGDGEEETPGLESARASVEEEGPRRSNRRRLPSQLYSSSSPHSRRVNTGGSHFPSPTPKWTSGSSGDQPQRPSPQQQQREQLPTPRRGVATALSGGLHPMDDMLVRPTPIEVRACLRAIETRLEQRVMSVFIAHLSVSRQPLERALWMRLDFNKYLSRQTTAPRDVNDGNRSGQENEEKPSEGSPSPPSPSAAKGSGSGSSPLYRLRKGPPPPSAPWTSSEDVVPTTTHTTTTNNNSSRSSSTRRMDVLLRQQYTHTVSPRSAGLLPPPGAQPVLSPPSSVASSPEHRNPHTQRKSSTMASRGGNLEGTTTTPSLPSSIAIGAPAKTKWVQGKRGTSRSGSEGATTRPRVKSPRVGSAAVRPTASTSSVEFSSRGGGEYGVPISTSAEGPRILHQYSADPVHTVGAFSPTVLQRNSNPPIRTSTMTSRGSGVVEPRQSSAPTSHPVSYVDPLGAMGSSAGPSQRLVASASATAMGYSSRSGAAQMPSTSPPPPATPTGSLRLSTEMLLPNEEETSPRQSLHFGDYSQHQRHQRS